MGVRSLREALRSCERADEVRARLAPATVHALESPSSALWHDGSIVVDYSRAARDVLGEAGVEELYYQALHCSLGAVIDPMLRAMFIVAGRRPQTLFSRLNGTQSVIMRGVRVSWAETSASSGTLIIHHEEEVDAVSRFGWMGSIRYGFHLVGVPGQVTPVPTPEQTTTFPFELRY